MISSAGRSRKINTDANSNSHPEYGLNEKVTFMKKSVWLERVNATFEIQFCEKARYSQFSMLFKILLSETKLGFKVISLAGPGEPIDI